MRTYRFQSLDELANYFTERGRRERQSVADLTQKSLKRRAAIDRASIWEAAGFVVRDCVITQLEERANEPTQPTAQ